MRVARLARCRPRARRPRSRSRPRSERSAWRRARKGSGGYGCRAKAGVASADGSATSASVARDAAAQLTEYLGGDRQEFELELDWADVGTEHRHLLEVLCEAAPFGVTVTYGELGRRAGIDDPRDVGTLMGRNPLPLVVPCHRVVAADGLGGYGGGLELKRRLLELEGVLPPRLDLGDV